MLLQIFIIVLVAMLLLEAVATSRAQTLPSISGSILLDDRALGRLALMGRQQELATYKLIDDPGNGFKHALRVSTKAGSESEWHAQLVVPIDESVQEGSVLLARFWMRCTESMTDEGFVGFVYEMARPEFDKAIEVRLGCSAKWKEYFVPFRAPRDFPAGQARVCLRVGYDRQTIEIAGLQLTNYGNSVKLEDLPRTRVSYAGRGEDAAWRRAALARIDKIRKGDLRVKVTDASGQSLPDAKVHVALKRHAFGFGSCVTVDNLLDPSTDGERYRHIVEENFNRAVFENDMKWPAVYDGIPPRLDRALQWLLDRRIDVRGHNLFWPSWRWLPSQLQEKKDDPRALRAIAETHATELVSHFKGKLIQWDVVNEVYTNHDLVDLLGGEDVMVEWFNLAHEADPDCKLFLNDYGILEGGPEGAHAKAFFNAIKRLKGAGAAIHGVGIQSHFAAALPSPMQVLATLDRFAELGLPIELTELSLNLDDRELQSDYLRDFLIAAFSHEKVQGVMLWGFWEKRHWRPQGALFGNDWSIRPHGQVWMDMIHRQWRTDETLRTDRQGVAGTRGFVGTYEITVLAGDQQKTVTAELKQNGTEVHIAVGER